MPLSAEATWRLHHFARPEHPVLATVIAEHRSLRAVFLKLAKRGISTVAYDMHGHGRSEPTLQQAPWAHVLIRSARHLTDDATLVLDELVVPLAAAGNARGERLPIYGVAHSMGSGVLASLEDARPGTFAVRFFRSLTANPLGCNDLCCC